jgi:hypothetical protein
MAFQPADFLTHHGFRRRAKRVWGLECATTVTAREPPQVPAVHSLHLPASILPPDWLGVASGPSPGDSPTLTGSGQAVSEPAAQCFKSAASTNFATGASRAV